ncbi:class I SAM-dependent methyltransferase [Mycobacterium sp. MMS18-G62]
MGELYGLGLADRQVHWLDIGCGYGEFLAALRATVAKGSTLAGSEPNEHKAEYARSRGFDVSYRELNDLTEQFTHISLLNVFSHLPEPVEFLQKARDLLVPGGELLIQTGNAGDLERHEVPGELWFPDHLIFAGRQTLDLLIEKLDMDVTRSTAQRYPRLTPVNLAKDVVKRITRTDYNPVSWRGAFRSVWVRAKKR